MDFFEIMLQQKMAGGGGSGGVSVDELSVSENGTYTAEEGHAYSPVTVNVPNSYAASDEGKVVSNGALVGQTSATKTANGTYDTTLNNEIVVNVPSVTPTGNINITSTAQTDVSAYATAQVVDADLVASNIKKDVDILGVVGTYEGGGGGTSYELIHEQDINLNVTSTSWVDSNSYTVPNVWTKDSLLFEITDKAGPRYGYMYKALSWAFNFSAINNASEVFSATGATFCIYKPAADQDWIGTAAGGVRIGYIYKNSSYPNIATKVRYVNGSTGTISGTYVLRVYKIKSPDGSSSIYPTT